MRKKHHAHKKSPYGKDLVILPIVFCAVIYIVCILVTMPAFGSYLSLGKMFFSDHEKEFSKGYVNIFVPVEESTEPVIQTSSASSQEPSAQPAKPKKEV